MVSSIQFNRRLLPSIERLQAFESAARHQSITLAAQELNLTQSAVSRQIQELENQLGVVLFNRVRRRIELSAAGRKFRPQALHLLQQAEELVIQTITAANATSIFSIAVLPTFGSRWLIPRLSSFIALHPGISLNIATRDGPFDLADHALDAAIHYGAPAWPRGMCRFLFNETVVPVASPLLLRDEALRGLSGDEVLARAPLLHLSTRPREWTVWFENLPDHAPIGLGHRLEHISSLISAAVSGLGIALVPKFLLEDELASGALVILSDRQLPTQASYHLVVPEHDAHNPLTASFYTWITTQISLETHWETL